MSQSQNAGSSPSARQIIGSATVTSCNPWLRHILPRQDWAAMAQALADDDLILLGMWADSTEVHALLLDETTLAAIPVSTPIRRGSYPSLAASRPGAILFERMIRDLWGHTANGGHDARPWLDHGAWPISLPMAPQPDHIRRSFGPIEPDHTDDVPPFRLSLGPITGLVEEAAKLCFNLRGSTIVSAEGQLGFTHKGTLALIRGKPPRTAARFAARLSGDSTVAHSIAFAAAIEAALRIEAPPRAVALRVVMLEIERIAGHLDNLAEIGRLAGAEPMRMSCLHLRELLVRASAAAFGHRLMMDCVVPGGVAADIAEGSETIILQALGEIFSRLPTIRRLHSGTALSARLNGVGRTDQTLATWLAAGGIAGRASGRRFDGRAMMAGYGASRLSAPRRIVSQAGDVAARQQLRIEEIEDSVRLAGAILDALPSGPLSETLPRTSGEGIACAESIRGDVWHWLRLDNGHISACFPRDPGWALWPLTERVLENNLVEDADLIRTSFALPASAMDL